MHDETAASRSRPKLHLQPTLPISALCVPVLDSIRACSALSRACAGHAGSRIGWALVGDKAVADLMRVYLQLHGGVPAESQARAANDLEFVLSTRGRGAGRTGRLPGPLHITLSVCSGDLLLLQYPAHCNRQPGVETMGLLACTGMQVWRCRAACTSCRLSKAHSQAAGWLSLCVEEVVPSNKTYLSKMHISTMRHHLAQVTADRSLYPRMPGPSQ